MDSYSPDKVRATLAKIHRQLIDNGEVEHFGEAEWALNQQHPQPPYTGKQSEIGELLSKADTNDAHDKINKLRSALKKAQAQHHDLHKMLMLDLDQECESAETCPASGSGTGILRSHRRFYLTLDRENRIEKIVS